MNSSDVVSARPDIDRHSQASVSIIVTTYNRANFLETALDSLLSQTRPADEIIVVDDASTDNTAAILERYEPQVRVLRQHTNIGKPAALNIAIPQARGSYLWLFDDDDIALPEALEHQLAFLSARPDLDFAYSDKYLFRGSGDIWERAHWRIDRLPDLPPEHYLSHTMLSMNTLLQGMLIPADCFHTVGPFDATLKRCEDQDMLLRLALRFRAGNMGQATFVYREHDGMRGAGTNRHAATDRYRVMLDYRRKIFRRLRRDFPLSSFLRRDDSLADPDPDDYDQALALSHRSCVMFRHGLIPEALEDLDAALAHDAIRRAASPEIRHVLAQSLDIEPWIWPNWLSDLYRLRRLLRHHRAHAASQYLWRGIYWNTRRDLQNRAYRQAMLSATQLLYFTALPLALRLTART